MSVFIKHSFIVLVWGLWGPVLCISIVSGVVDAVSLPDARLLSVSCMSMSIYTTLGYVNRWLYLCYISRFNALAVKNRLY
jgi:hypothetical protein